MRKYLFAFGLSFLFCSCSMENDNCLEYSVAGVYNADMPQTGSVGDTIPVMIMFTYSSSCGKSGYPIISASGRNIKVDILATYEGCLCLGSFVSDSVEYDFIPAFAGTYIFNFGTYEGTEVRDTIRIF